MELRVGRSYRVGHKIGSFDQQVYSGTNVYTGEDVVIKLEPLRSRSKQLLWESKMYKLLNQNMAGVPLMKHVCTDGDYNCLVVERKGPTLQDMLERTGRFPLKTVLMLADQLLTRLKDIHSLSYIHGSVKPDNFVLGTGSQKDICYVIDLATMRRFEDPNTHRHIPGCMARRGGNVRWISLKCHEGYEQSRRDDLESLGYMFVYFLRGTLPWYSTRAGAATSLLWKTVLASKQQLIESKTLCAGLPVEFQQYFDYVMSLQFEETPDYSYLRKLFRDLFEREGYTDEGGLDWSGAKYNAQASLATDTVNVQSSATVVEVPSGTKPTVESTFISLLSKAIAKIEAKGP